MDIYIDQHGEERRTRAEAWLRTEDQPHLRAVGKAQRNPYDREVPEIGDELAAARALGELARQLRATAAHDIEQELRIRTVS